jgi:hypothetical protein
MASMFTSPHNDLFDIGPTYCGYRVLLLQQLIILPASCQSATRQGSFRTLSQHRFIRTQ